MSGLHSLSQSLYRLKQLCGEGIFEADHERVHRVNVTTDYDWFRERVRATDWVGGAALVSGIVGGETSVSSAPYEHWLDGVRATFYAELITVLQGLESSLEWEQIDRLIQLVRPQLADEPEVQRLSSLATRALRLRDSAAIEPGNDLKHFFVGRTRELSSLSDHQKRGITSGVPTSAIISGPAGIGKSALSERFLRLNAVRGGRSIRARGFAAEANLAFGIVGQLLDDGNLTTNEIGNWVRRHGLGEAATTGPDPDDNSTQEIRGNQLSQLHLFNTVRTSFLNFASSQPLVVLVDDCQWMDHSSQSFLHFLARRPFAPGLLLLLTCSKAEVAAASALFPSATLIELVGLDIAAVELMSRRFSGTPAFQDPEDVLRKTGGNPFYIRALHSVPEWHRGNRGANASPNEFLKTKLRGLSEEARLLLAALAVLGDRASLLTAITVAGIEDAAAGTTVLELERYDLIDTHDTELRCTHSLAGEAVLADAPAVVKRLLHARAARELLEQGQSPAAVLAVKLDIAGEATQAFTSAIAAARASLNLSAHREAEYFLKLALSHTKTTSAEAKVRLQLADLYFRMGVPARAAAVVDWPLWSSVSPADKLWSEAYRVAAALTPVSNVDETLKQGWELERAAREYALPDAAAFILVRIASLSDMVGRLEDARRAANLMIELLPHLEPGERAISYRTQAAAVIGLTESTAKAKLLLDEAHLYAEAPEARVQLKAASALLHFTGGQLREAEADYLAALSLCERYGVHNYSLRLLNNLGVCYLELGEYSESEASLRRAADYALMPAELMITIENLSLIALAEGDYDKCLHLLGRASELNREVESMRTAASVLGTKGLAYLSLGQLSNAFECERELRQVEIGNGLYLPDMSYVEIFNARMHQLRGEEEAAVRGLSRAILAYQDRDRFCRSRLQIELLRVRSRTAESEVLAEARVLEIELAAIGAAPLLAELRSVIAAIPG